MSEQQTTFEATVERSNLLETAIQKDPTKYRVLTGDRPTGRLHIGHLFGSLENRVRLQNLGVPTYIVIADYQVLTDRELGGAIGERVQSLVVDYLAAGLDPSKDVTIFPHSYIPELNQLLLPFLTLVSSGELNRNPTVKEEITASGLTTINAGMYVYPIHQAADILAMKGTVVPVGKDQLPHLEMTRTIAKRFNKKFAKKDPVFQLPQPLLSKAPMIMGLDGGQKMSKSRNNTIMLSATADETAALIKRAKTDTIREITYDPETRPEVANLLLLLSLSTGESPESLAQSIGDGGAKVLKEQLTEGLNSHLAPVRARMADLEKNPDYIREVLQNGIDKARNVAAKTLQEVQEAMAMLLT